MNGILETESQTETQTETQSVSNTHNKMRSCAERKRKYEKRTRIIISSILSLSKSRARHIYFSWYLVY